MSGRRRKKKAASAESEARVLTMHATVKAELKERPGVYHMISPEGEIIYVGKSKKLRTRLMGYFRAEYPAEKGARILREAAEVKWEYLPSEFEALLEELRLIKRWRPRFNVMMKRDARHHAFIKMSRGSAPKLAVARSAGTDDTGVYFGPFHGAHQLEDALRELNDVLGLRDCRNDMPMHFSDQVEFPEVPPRTPGCIRFEIGKCLGPCVAATTVAEYRDRFGLARKFLEGTYEAPLASLRAAMRPRVTNSSSSAPRSSATNCNGSKGSATSSRGFGSPWSRCRLCTPCPDGATTTGAMWCDADGCAPCFPRHRQPISTPSLRRARCRCSGPRSGTPPPSRRTKWTSS